LNALSLLNAKSSIITRQISKACATPCPAFPFENISSYDIIADIIADIMIINAGIFKKFSFFLQTPEFSMMIVGLAGKHYL
jgi:hypothetical protein